MDQIDSCSIAGVPVDEALGVRFGPGSARRVL